MTHGNDKKTHLAILNLVANPNFGIHVSVQKMNSICRDFKNAKKRSETLLKRSSLRTFADYLAPVLSTLNKHEAFIKKIRPVQEIESIVIHETRLTSMPALYQWNFIHNDKEACAFARLIVAHRKLTTVLDAGHGGSRPQTKISIATMKKRQRLYNCLRKKVAPALARGHNSSEMYSKYRLNSFGLELSDIVEYYGPPHQWASDIASIASQRSGF